MKKLLKKGMAAMLCMSLFLVVGCKKDNPVISGGGPGEEPEPIVYPIDVPFTEYTLSETCQWKNLDYDEKVIIINNDRELGIYTACEGGGYPEVDFEKQTLLLTSGSASRNVEKITVNYLQQLSENDYELNIELLLYDILIDTTAAEKWILALITEKISEESTVKLTIAEYPIDVPFEEYFVHWSHKDKDSIFLCWKNLNHDINAPWEGKAPIINNNKELENYLICPEDYPAIDFSKYTLVIASSMTGSSLSGFSDVALVKNSTNQYTLTITIREGFLTMGDYWCVAILTPKIEDVATVLLTVNHIQL